MTTLPLAAVTGAPGWLGTRLVRTMAQGLPGVDPFAQGQPRKIRVLTLPDQDTRTLADISGDVQIVSGDLNDPRSLDALLDGARGGAVFHCAGVIHPTRGVRQFYDVNVDGTRNLLAAAAKAGVRRFVHVSSNSPLGCNPRRDHLFDEDSPYNPYMNYGRSKKLAEDLVNDAGRRGPLEIVIIRPPWFYGPDQPERQTRFFRMIKEGKVPLVGDGENRRSMAYVDNICQGLFLAERTPGAAGRAYWIADRRPYTMNEIIDTIEAVLEKDFGVAVARKRRRLPGVVSDVAQLADQAIQGLGFYQQEIHVLSEMNKTIACTIGRAESELGYAPQVDLAEGMRRSVQWMLDRGVTL
jgi:nucleoside-diphosphate-sugar epimerase